MAEPDQKVSLTGFVHFSEDSISTWDNRHSQQRDSFENQAVKPQGLYFARGDAWKNRRRAEGFHLSKFRAAHLVSVSAAAKVLMLSEAGLPQVYAKYGYTSLEGTNRVPRLKWGEIKNDFYGVYVPGNILHMKEWSEWAVETLCLWNNAAGTLTLRAP